MNRQLVAATGPARARVPEDARLRVNRRVAIERTGWDNDEIRLFYVTRHLAAAHRAEATGEALRFRYFVSPDQFLALDPIDRPGLDEQVRGMPRTRCLAAARAVAMIKPLWVAADFVLDGTAETASAKGRLSHELSVER